MHTITAIRGILKSSVAKQNKKSLKTSAELGILKKK